MATLRKPKQLPFSAMAYPIFTLAPLKKTFVPLVLRWATYNRETFFGGPIFSGHTLHACCAFSYPEVVLRFFI